MNVTAAWKSEPRVAFKSSPPKTLLLVNVWRYWLDISRQTIADCHAINFKLQEQDHNGGMNCDETNGQDEDDIAKDEWQQLLDA